jgi:hypothetical protein
VASVTQRAGEPLAIKFPEGTRIGMVLTECNAAARRATLARMRPRLSLVLASLCIAACSAKMYQPTPTSDEFPTRAEKLLGMIGDRAAFDLQCDAASLGFKYIDTNTVGVVGCGKRAVYVKGAGSWVLNGAAETTTD